MSVQLLPSAVLQRQRRLSAALLFNYSREMQSGSLISVYCMQKQQAWNTEDNNYSPNEADLRHSQQWNTF